MFSRTACDVDPRMVKRLKEIGENWKDSDGRRRLNPILGNFSSVHTDFERADCIPDFVIGKNKLKPRFDIVLADFGYNSDQLDSVEGLSYMGIRPV